YILGSIISQQEDNLTARFNSSQHFRLQTTFHEPLAFNLLAGACDDRRLVQVKVPLFFDCIFHSVFYCNHLHFVPNFVPFICKVPCHFTVYLHPHYDGNLSRHIQCIYFFGHYLVIVPVYFCDAFLSGQFFIRFLQCSSRFFRFFFRHFFCCFLCNLLRNPWC